MVTRIRSLLIDNTLGKIFTGVSKTAEGSADKLIAGTKLLSKSITQNKRFIVVPTKNLGNGQGLILSAKESLLTQIIMTAFASSAGQPVTISVLKGLTYSTSTELGRYNLAEGSKSVQYYISHKLLPGEKIFVDVITSGSTRRAAGLSLTFMYYGG